MELHLTLPGGLLAKVSITEISDELDKRIKSITDKLQKQLTSDSESSDEEMEEVDDQEETITLTALFKVGQIVSCMIKSKSIKEIKLNHGKAGTKATSNVKKYKNLEATLKPTIINKDKLNNVHSGMVIIGSVATEEDHGYIIHFGDKKSGFVKKKKGEEGNRLEIGQLLTCIVDKSYTSDNPIIPVSEFLGNEAEKPTKSSTKTSIQSLFPGMLVKVEILKILDRGLAVRFLDFFNGTIEFYQIDFSQKSLEKQFSIGNKVNARIILINYEIKRVYLSIKSNILQWKSESMSANIGDKYDATISHSSDNFGIDLVLPKPPHYAFVHVSPFPILSLQQFFLLSIFPNLFLIFSFIFYC